MFFIVFVYCVYSVFQRTVSVLLHLGDISNELQLSGLRH